MQHSQHATSSVPQGDFTGLLHSLNPLGETEKKATKVCDCTVNLLARNNSFKLMCTTPHLVPQLRHLSHTAQERSVKTSAVRCLAQCITTYLRRFAPSTASTDLLKWLKRAMSGIIGQLKKASFPSSEQQACLHLPVLNLISSLPCTTR